MNPNNTYTTETFEFGDYKFKYAHWGHRFVGKAKFTLDDILTQTTYLKEGDIVIDIGGFSGDTPILYANAVGSTGKVITFEPNPHSYSVLNVNAELNSHLNIHPVNKAITETEGNYIFHYSDDEYCNGGFATEIDFGIGATGHTIPLDVSGVNLTEWIDTNLTKDEINRISFIKIDTEGYDYKILRSNKELFKRIRPILEVELYPALTIKEVKELYLTLTEIGYDVFKQNNRRDCSLESITHSLSESQFVYLFKNIKSGEDIVAYPSELIPKNKKMITKKDISFIQPSRNNLKYLKWSYDSIRKNGGPEPTICVADDFSNDGTWEWCEDMMEKDPNFKAIRNEGPTRLGHTILYDELVEIADTPIIGIYHADMYLMPKALDFVIKHIEPLSVVSLTRIEPPLHPDGPEKMLMDFGIEPEEFKEDEMLEWFEKVQMNQATKQTEGIFAPWFMFKEDFTSINGHDPLFAPQSKEDTDIFNRFHLNGYKFVQTWGGCVYHMTCRGSRFADGAQRNPNGDVFMKNRETDEWLTQNQRSTRNFLRKWGHMCKHDELMKPIVPPKYNIQFVIENGNPQLLELLEPWCDNINISIPQTEIDSYIKKEQPNTDYKLSERINQDVSNDIQIVLDGSKFTQNSFNIIQQISAILESNEIEKGEFELDIFKIKVNRVKTYEHNLICRK